MTYRECSLACVWLIMLASAGQADIFRWDNGQLIPGTEGITPAPGVQLFGLNLEFADLSQADLTRASLQFSRLAQADLTGAVVEGALFADTTRGGFTREQLYSTASYLVNNLRGISLMRNNLNDWNFSEQDLTDADFNESRLTGVNLQGAIVTGAGFAYTTSRGFTREQLYATASYPAKNLRHIGLSRNNLTDWDFSEQDLTGADFNDSRLTGVSLRGAIVTSASFNSSNGFTLAQLYSTASYRMRNLREIGLVGIDLGGSDLSGQDLTAALLIGSTLDSANLRGAIVTGANFNGTTSRGFTRDQLYATASYEADTLEGIDLSSNDLTGWDFTGQNLAGASFYYSKLTDTIFAGAIATGADFSDTTSRGFTPAQLYSTASYQARNLDGILLQSNDLAGWDFSGQYLANALLPDTELTRTDLTGADARAAFSYKGDFAAAFTTNFIFPDGEIRGLVLRDGQSLVVRDHDGRDGRISFGYPVGPVPIMVLERMSIVDGGRLQLLFEDDAWDSTISFAPGIPVDLEGILELTFADNVDLTAQVGRTLHVFDWAGVAPNGQFEIRSPYVWDTTNLYTSGDVRLVAVPEPSAALILLSSVMALATCCRITTPMPSR